MPQTQTAVIKKKAEALRTFDDSESAYNGSRPFMPNQNDSSSPKKFTNEFSDKETMKQLTIVSYGQETKNAHQNLKVPENAPPVRSLTNAYDKEKRKSKGGIIDNQIVHHSSSKVKRPPGGMSNQIKPINNMGINANTSERDSPLQHRKDTFSENDSPRGSFIEEKPAPDMKRGTSTKENSKLKTYGINIQDVTSKDTLNNPPTNSKDVLDNSLIVNPDIPLSSNRLDGSIMLGASLPKPKDEVLSAQLKSPRGILKKTDDKKNRSVFDMAISVHSQRSKIGKGMNKSTSLIPKSVKFAPEDQIFLVESFKKFNKDEYYQETTPKKCCSEGCTLI